MSDAICALGLQSDYIMWASDVVPPPGMPRPLVPYSEGQTHKETRTCMSVWGAVWAKGPLQHACDTGGGEGFGAWIWWWVCHVPFAARAWCSGNRCMAAHPTRLLF